MNVTRWMLCLAGSLGLALALLPSGCGDYHPCEEDLDCFIVCDCPGLVGTTTVGPYACRSGNCGAAHARDMDCERPCEDAFVVPPGSFDDDDSAGDGPGPGDDDSGDDDSGL